MSIKKNIIAKIITKPIALAVFAVTALFAGSAQAYIPSNIDMDVQSSFSFQAPSLFGNDNATTPMPRRLPFFSSETGFSTFRVTTEVAAVAPLGFQIFCLQNPNECNTSTRDKVTKTFRTMQRIAAVNRDVNKSIIGRNDVGMDQWTLNPAEGDCEDYALTKRAQLVASGMPISALRIATALTPSGEGHAVLIVRTDRGDLVLDNLTNSIRPWNKTNLEILTVSGANPSQWFNIA